MTAVIKNPHISPRFRVRPFCMKPLNRISSVVPTTKIISAVERTKKRMDNRLNQLNPNNPEYKEDD